MKHHLRIIGLCTLLLSAVIAAAAAPSEERFALIVGTYSSQENAQRQVQRLETHFSDKPQMVELQEANGFDYLSEAVSDYFVVAIKPIVGTDALDKVYAEARSVFPDLYVSRANNYMTIDSRPSGMADVPAAVAAEPVAEPE